LAALRTLAERLSALSELDRPLPDRGLAWPEAFDPEAWAFAPALSALTGHPAYDQLDEATRKRLALFEAVNFFSLNINGERALIEGLARRCDVPDTAEVSGYIHHFLEEESQHMRIFGTFCRRYAGKVYPDRKLVFARDHAPGEEDFLFWAKVTIFEVIADAYNCRMMDDATLHPLVAGIHRMHHHDESRHLAFGFQLVRKLWTTHAPGWCDEVRAGVRDYLAAYVQSTWKEYHNPAMLRDAGLPNAYELSVASFDTETARARRRAFSRPAIGHLVRLGVFDEEPVL
jgi:hypothetical protein